MLKLDVPPDEIDALILRRESERLERDWRKLASMTVYEDASRALDLWRGPMAIVGLEEDANSLAQVYLTLQRLRLQAMIEIGYLDGAVALLPKIIDEHAFDEKLVDLLMRAQYMARNQHAALAAFNAADERLTKVGYAPTKTLLTLRDAVQRMDDSVVVLAERGSSGSSHVVEVQAPTEVPVFATDSGFWTKERVEWLRSSLESRGLRLSQTRLLSAVDDTLASQPPLLLVDGVSWRDHLDAAIGMARRGPVPVVILDEDPAVARTNTLVFPTKDANAALMEAFADALATQLRERSSKSPSHPLWPYSPDAPVHLVCAELPEEMRLPYAEARTPDHLRLARFADIDALFTLNTGLLRLAPQATLRPAVAAELHPDLLGEDLVLIGGPAWNHLTELLTHQLGVPFDHLDGGPGHPDPYRLIGSDEIFEPEFSPAGDVVRDVGLFVRAPNPVNRHTTVTICSGILTHGVEGAAKAFVDASCFEENFAWARAQFGEPLFFSILFRISVVNNFNVAPRLAVPDTLIAQARWLDAQRRFVLDA